MNKSTKKENLLNPNEVASRLSCSYETICRWLRSGKMQGKKGPGGWRISEEEVERFLPVRLFD